jgi:hypothetical protein
MLDVQNGSRLFDLITISNACQVLRWLRGLFQKEYARKDIPGILSIHRLQLSLDQGVLSLMRRVLSSALILVQSAVLNAGIST